MKPEIENLKAQIRGVKLNYYQKGLALDEFYKLIDYVTELEKLSQPLVSSSVCHCNNLPDGEIGISSKALQRPYGDLGQTDC
jgi:hypothetical protein